MPAATLDATEIILQLQTGLKFSFSQPFLLFFFIALTWPVLIKESLISIVKFNKSLCRVAVSLLAVIKPTNIVVSHIWFILHSLIIFSIQ